MPDYDGQDYGQIPDDDETPDDGVAVQDANGAPMPPGRPRSPAPPPQPSATLLATQPTFPPRWDQNQQQIYDEKASGLAQVQRDLDLGELHPHDALPAIQEYQSALAQMDQQKQAAMQMQQQSATNTALHGMAMQQAVTVQNQQHAAQSFPQTMVEHIDPVTGQRVTFYQAEPGKWAQVDFGSAPQVQAPTIQSPASDASFERPEAGEMPELGEADRPVGDQPGQAQPGGPFVQTINNGPYRTDTTWQPGQTNGVSTGDWRGQPNGQPPQDPAATGFGLNPQVLNRIKAMAANSTAMMAPGQHRDIATARILQGLIQQQQHHQLQTERMTGQSDLLQKRADISAKAKAENEHTDKWLASKRTHLKEMVDTWHKQHPLEDLPADQRTAMGETAKTMADQDHLDAYGLLPKSRQTQPKPVAGNGTPQAKDQSQQFDALMQKVMGPQGTSAGPPLTPEVANKESSIPFDRVNQLGLAAVDQWNNSPMWDRGGGDNTYVGLMHVILEKAALAKRGLTVGERYQYERLVNQIRDPQLKAKLKP
jgi:hypothetical protein